VSGYNLGCWFVPCDGRLAAGVLVRDPSGVPLGGVHVAIFGYSGETDSNGCVKIDGVGRPASVFHNRDVVLHVEREVSEQRPFDAYRVDITLQPAGSSKPSAAAWTPARSAEPLECRQDAPVPAI
jgi:hypothetical protein